jgi:hypothetical protein
VLRFYVLYVFNTMRYPYAAQFCPRADSQAQTYAGQFMLYKILGTIRTVFRKLVRVVHE